LLGLVACKPQSKPPDLKERYGMANTKPFGAFTAYQLLKSIYPGQSINLSTQKFASFYNDLEIDSGTLYVNISNRYLVAEEDASSLLNFVYNGNTAFIAASDIDSNLLHRLATTIQSNPLENLTGFKLYKQTSVNLLPDELSVKDSFSYFYKPFSNYFASSDAKKSRITGYDNNGNANFLVFFWGKGRLYLHCEPRAFSNYFLLTNDNYFYMTQIMQMMEEKPTAVYWDEHYNKINFRENNAENGSAIGALMKEPPLASAFWLLLAMLLLYVLINGKRKQRIVPIIPPIQNTSVAFTSAVAGVYMAEKDNKNIADKIITYFNEHIRTRYFLYMHNSTTEQGVLLSRKSGVSSDMVKELYDHIQYINNNTQVSDTDLLILNKHIENFYKNRQ
jgi:hypothetical protein